MRYALLVFILLPSCTFLKGLQDSAANTAKITGKVDKALEKVDAGLTAITAAKTAADTNKDGKTDSMEWLYYLLGGGGLVGGAVAEGRRRVGVRNAESDARKTQAEARIEALEKAQA